MKLYVIQKLFLILWLVNISYVRAATDSAKLTVFKQGQPMLKQLSVQYGVKHFGVNSFATFEKVNADQLREVFTLSFAKDDRFVYAKIQGDSPNLPIGLSKMEFLVCGGDDIIIDMNGDDVSFYGKGHKKIECIYRLKTETEKWESFYRDSIMRQRPVHDYSEGINTLSLPQELVERITKSYSRLNFRLDLLEEYRGDLNPFIFDVIKANLIGDEEMAILYVFKMYYSRFPDKNVNNFEYDSIKDTLMELYINRRSMADLVDDEVAKYASGYINYLTAYFSSSSIMGDNGLKALLNNFDGELRDRLLLLHFIRNFHKIENADQQIEKALRNIGTGYCKTVLETLYNSLRKGSDAYQFALIDTMGTTITLEQLKGKTVIMKFWFSGCVGCKVLAKQMQPIVDSLQDESGIVFVNISVDKDMGLWKKSVRSHLYTHSGNMDLYTNGKGADHPIIKHYGIISYPRIIIIDKMGAVLSANPERPSGYESRQQFIGLILRAERR